MENKTFKENEKFFDVRMLRPIVVNDKKTDVSYTLQQTESFSIDGKDVVFYKPNNISLFVSIAHRELEIAKKLFSDFVQVKLLSESPVEFIGDENSKLYDYFERVQTSIIAIYTAVESLSNVAIPSDFKFHKVNSKKIKEIWEKDSIERWLSTSEKLSEIVPGILNIVSPNKLRLWSFFKQLEVIRNDIIHQKTITKDPIKVDTLFIRKFLDENIFTLIESGFAIIQYFCTKNKTHSFFPFGFGEVHIFPIEVEDFDEYFALVDA